MTGKWEDVGCWKVYKEEMTLGQYCTKAMDPHYKRTSETKWMAGTAEELVTDIKNGKPDWTSKAEKLFEGVLESFMPETMGELCSTTGVAGFMPNVPAYIAGRPDSMFCHEEDEGLGPIRIYISLICSAGIKRDEMLWRGLAIAAYAYAMQMIRPVELYGVISCNSNNGQNRHHCLTIPLGTSPINLSQLAVVLGHVGIGRRGLQMGPKGKKETFGGWQRCPAKEMLGLREEDIFFPGLQLSQDHAVGDYEAAKRFVLSHLPKDAQKDSHNKTDEWMSRR